MRPAPGALIAVVSALLTVALLLGVTAAAPIRTTARLDRGVAIAGVALTPPMGWNTWNTYGCDISAPVVQQAADALVASGMRDAGYRYVVVDDCWFATSRGPGGALRADPARFPQGMRALADYVHARGLKFGIYESPNERTCAQLGGTYPGRTGSAGHEELDARTFADWGVDYLKYDWCAPESDLDRQVAAFTRMRDALRDTGRPIVYSINTNSDVLAVPPGAIYDWSGIATMWRTTNDVTPAWELGLGIATSQGIREILDTTAPLTVRAGPGHWPDPDMLEVGVAGIPGTLTPGLTAAEQRTQFGMWALLAAPLIAGNALPAMDLATRALLTNPEVIAVDQDPLAAAATAVPGTGTTVWRRTMSDGSVVVALSNRDRVATRIETTAAALGLPAAYRYEVHDLWTGAASSTDGALGATVGAHDTLLLRIRPDTSA
ncbi:glycoside hydrolase family 27 protein [Nocardia sp. alder85J]|uniref:glycoside hydrolase family 27 protein n=1 Tax=Nocardia sp. alder85J TaxID=2862949 RepID=UPI001CD792AA|nr:glycoside hydrolase family 27 protein [Nocardia sp. alder85J]MCX4096018.1 glycoside hydrolase family 27 protein [Nocardia sp. alder85J]